MKKESLKMLLLVIFTLLFNFFFWEEKFGVNIVLFNGLLTVVLSRFLYSERFKASTVKVALFCVFLTAVMLIYHNTFVSKLAHIISFLVLIGFVSGDDFKTFTQAIGNYLYNFSNVLIIIREISKELNKRSEDYFFSFGKFSRVLKILFLPTIIFIIFFVLYRLGNPVFDKYSESFFSVLNHYISYLFKNISFSRIFFIAIGGYLTTSVLFKYGIKLNVKKYSVNIQNDSNSTDNQQVRNEFWILLVVMLTVNLLLFIQNVIDIKWLWLDFNYSEISNFGKLVHEGTEVLILTIVLTMAILIYYFRARLNFTKNYHWLKRVAYIWLGQNVVLVFSVFLRNFYYIHEQGLSHKRIGVYVFLTLTLFGLCTMFYKVMYCKATFYLFKINTWAWYFTLISLSVIDWDLMIVNQNINHINLIKNVAMKGKIDKEYLLILSDKTLPILKENLGVFPDEEQKTISFRTNNYLEEQAKYSWLSWNWADYQAVKRLNSLDNHAINSK